MACHVNLAVMSKKNAKVSMPPFVLWLRNVEQVIQGVPELTNVPPQQSRRARTLLTGASDTLAQIAVGLDHIRLPAGMFDPADPRVIGRIVALAFLAQPRIALASLANDRFYGSGIYAIYYNGTFNAYKPIAKKEHPIYIGKANPKLQNAKSIRDQGEKLASRLREHFKSVGKAVNLSGADFDCRFLVVASGWEEAAEKHLINLYKPIWNSETKICFGIGKHGDAPTTRANKRSPWDTMHSGRAWAADSAKDQIPEAEIRRLLAIHFKANVPITTQQGAATRFLKEMSQF